MLQLEVEERLKLFLLFILDLIYGDLKKDDLNKKKLAKISLGVCSKVVAVSNELKDAMISEKVG